MKECSRCKTSKLLEEFNRKGTGYQAYCRVCSRQSYKTYYAENTEQEIRRIKTRRKRIYDGYKELKDSLKCELCPESEPCAIEFHHEDPKRKDFNIAQAAAWGYSWERLEREIAKCHVLCCNCHRKVHAGVIPLGKT